jgi:hypothetical protein
MNKKIKLKDTSKILIILEVLFVALILLTLSYYNKKLTNKVSDSVSYNVNNNIDYNVCLKTNNYYDRECLDKNNTYVADLIDYINIDFSYALSSSQALKENYSYNITSQIVATNKENSSEVIYNKQDVLVPDTSFDEDNSNQAIINKSLKLNYADYSNIITNFKKDYVLALDAKLIITMNINYKGVYADNFEPITDTKSLSIDIPLSELTVDINTNIGNTSYNNTIYPSKVNNESSKKVFLLLVLLDVVILLLIIYYLSILIPSKKEFYKKLDKILKEYDRAIVTTTEIPNLDGKNIIPVINFDELLDARDNLERPILYYKYKSKDKALFIIIYDSEAYLYTLTDL